jgi:hypothetical protein
MSEKVNPGDVTRGTLQRVRSLPGVESSANRICSIHLSPRVRSAAAHTNS